VKFYLFRNPKQSRPLALPETASGKLFVLFIIAVGFVLSLYDFINNGDIFYLLLTISLGISGVIFMWFFYWRNNSNNKLPIWIVLFLFASVIAIASMSYVFYCGPNPTIEGSLCY